MDTHRIQSFLNVNGYGYQYWKIKFMLPLFYQIIDFNAKFKSACILKLF